MELRSSPHIKSSLTVETIMFNVVLALLPVCAFAVFAFGTSAVLLLITSTAACVIAEDAICRISGKPTTIGNWSAVITGLLLGLTLPPTFPLWMTALGGVVAIGLGKVLFGGLGFNVFNPALVGRAFLQAAFPAAMTTWAPAFGADRFVSLFPSTLAFPFSTPSEIGEYVEALGVDAFTGATPLMLMKSDIGSEAFQAITYGDLLLGRIAGSTGETCAALILLGGIYLIARRMMDWRITAAIFGTVFILSGAFWLVDSGQYPSPLFMLLSGGLALGAVYMATDMVSSPTTPLGAWIFGAMIGVLVVIIRLKGGLPEAVMYAILLGNAATPIINYFTQPRIYGARKKEATS